MVKVKKSGKRGLSTAPLFRVLEAGMGGDLIMK